MRQVVIAGEEGVGVAERGSQGVLRRPLTDASDPSQAIGKRVRTLFRGGFEMTLVRGHALQCARKFRYDAALDQLKVCEAA